MIRILAEQRTVYRAVPGRRARLTRKAAYADAAWFAFRTKHPPERIEVPEDFVGGPHHDEWTAYSKRVVARLARWLQWRDRRIVQIAQTTGFHFTTTGKLSPEAVREILGTAKVVLRVGGVEQ